MMKELEETHHSSIESGIVGSSKYVYRFLTSMKQVRAKVKKYKETTYKEKKKADFPEDTFLVGWEDEALDKILDIIYQIKENVKGRETKVQKDGKAVDPPIEQSATAWLTANHNSELTKVTDVAKLKAFLVAQLIAKLNLLSGSTRPMIKIGTHRVSNLLTVKAFLDAIAKREWKKIAGNESKEPPTTLTHLTTTSAEYGQLIQSWALLLFVQYEQLKSFGHLAGVEIM
jgi:hypothetical protein